MALIEYKNQDGSTTLVQSDGTNNPIWTHKRKDGSLKFSQATNQDLIKSAIKLIGLNELASRIESLSGEAMSRQNLRKYEIGERTIQPWLISEVQMVLRNHMQQLNDALEAITAKMVENYRAQISEPLVPVAGRNSGITSFAEKLQPETFSDIDYNWCDRKKNWQDSMRYCYKNDCEYDSNAPSVGFAQALIACGHSADELVEIYRSEKSGEYYRTRLELISKIWDTIEANDLPRDSSTHEDEEELF